jgi:hypothetical protein
MKRDQEFYRTVDKIIDEVWQHSYEIFSVKKFARAQSLRKPLPEGKEFCADNRSFFCSELCAFFYKNLGIFVTD